MRKLILASVVCGSMASGQSAREKIELDLKLAREQLEVLEVKILREERKIVREVEKIDDQVAQQHKTIAKLLRDEDDVTGKQRQLNNELARRKGEFEYTLSSLRSYGSGLRNRLHPIEKQGVGAVLEQRRKKADKAGDDLVLEIQDRLALLHIAAERLTQVHGGQLVEGSSVGDGSMIKEGRFAMAGPLGYFAATDGSTSGFTTFSPDGIDFPSLAPLLDSSDAIQKLVKTGEAVVPVDASMGKAIRVARTKKTVKDYIEGGGPVGYGIMGIGLFALLIALFKAFEILSFPIPSRRKVNLILDDLFSGDREAAEQKAEQARGLGGQMVAAGVTFFEDKRRIMENALVEKLGLIQLKLDRFLPFLALVAAAAPMMGLLGTVLGIMETFAMMSAVGSGDSNAFSAGISAALITTAMGLIVAIPVIVIHGVLKSLAKAKFGQAEGVALALLNGAPAVEVSPEKPDRDDLDDLDLVTA